MYSSINFWQIKRTHLSEDKILELSNVEKYRGYALKIDGEEMSKFVINTKHFDEKYDRTIIVGDTKPKNISINVPLKFLSTLLVKGIVYILGK